MTAQPPNHAPPAAQAAAGDGYYGELLTNGFLTGEDGAPYLPERLLQIVWNEQLLTRPLQTADGQPLEVIHPGVWNLEAGPDFREAVLALGGDSRRGPVEVHLRPEDWTAHGHAADPAYAATVLHVVWENPHGHQQYPPGVPLLVLRERLTLPVAELLARNAAGAFPYARQVPPGEWAAQFAALDDPALRSLLEAHGLSRLLRKAGAAGELIERYGLDEAAYRLCGEALGYKDNRRAFARLTAALPLASLPAATPRTAQALLFGTAGLLPDPTRAPILPAYQALVHELWDLWGSRREGYEELPWTRRHRPFNAPARRLLALHLLLQQHDYRPGTRLVAALAEAPDGATALAGLTAGLALDDAPWRRFYDFTRELETPAALLGADRRADLVVNVALPLFLAWCFLERRPHLCHRAKDVFRRLPRLQDNRRLKEAVHFFFVPPSRAGVLLANACAQQGLLELYQEIRPGPPPRAGA